MAKEFAVLTRQRPTRYIGEKWEHETIVDRVRVMARAEGYAMVRFPGCVPFIVSEKQLTATPFTVSTDHSPASSDND